MPRVLTWANSGYRQLTRMPAGNQTAASGDFVPMRCSRFREALSARLDGEDPAVPETRIDGHLATCPDCRRWAAAAGLLAALLEEGRPGRTPLVSVREWRIALATIAAVQLLVTAWPGLLSGGHASAHLAHMLTSWNLGLAIGFLFLAWQPSRAWGSLPLVALLVACLMGASVLDLFSGDPLLGRGSVHLLELAGLGCLWMLARRMPRSSVVLRLA
jgi:predicted anti-sigma-YlaC factor YlaD